MDPTGTSDPKKGIREFIVGTGGESLDTLITTPSTPNVEASTDQYYGTMTLTLNQNSYSWDFESSLEPDRSRGHARDLQRHRLREVPRTRQLSLAKTSCHGGRSRSLLAGGRDRGSGPCAPRRVYGGDAGTVAVGMQLPPGCTTGCVAAVADGTYPTVFNNDLVDSSFGVTSHVFLDQLTPAGTPVSSLEVPNSSQNGVPPTKDQLVTSFSSKSELALNLSTDGRYLTFMGYLAPVNALDVSNSNTPGVFDSTNPVPGSYYRVVGQVDAKGQFKFTRRTPIAATTAAPRS